MTAPVLDYFDPSKETRLHTHASTLGLGFLLLQKQTNSNSDWRIVQAGSRFLTDAESSYAVFKLECLAVTWAIKKCNLFLTGLDDIMIVTYHNPVIPILNSHRMYKIENPRLQHLQTRIMLLMPSPVTHTSNHSQA